MIYIQHLLLCGFLAKGIFEYDINTVEFHFILAGFEKDTLKIYSEIHGN